MIFDHISNKDKYRSLPWLYGALEAMAPELAADIVDRGITANRKLTAFLSPIRNTLTFI